jgi:hypothetical protein
MMVLMQRLVRDDAQASKDPSSGEDRCPSASSPTGCLP